MNANLAGLRAEHIALDADEVAQVEQLLEDGVVESRVLAVGKCVARHIDLYSSLRVLQFCESRLAHDALRHDASCDADVAAVLGRGSLVDVFALFVLADDRQVNEVFLYLRAESVGGIFGCGIGIDT